MIPEPLPNSQPFALLSLCLCLSRSYIYQKRWVRLDTDHLRYFDSNKVRPVLVRDMTLLQPGLGLNPNTGPRWSPSLDESSPEL